MILADTHVLAWWLCEPTRLSKAQVSALERRARAGEPLAISAITLVEMATAIARGRIAIDDSALLELAARGDVTVLPITARVAVEAARLGPRAPRDPADRIIIATARLHAATLLTADEAIRSSGLVAVT